MRSRAIPALAVTLLLAPLAFRTIPALAGNLRLAIRLVTLPLAERRAIVLGSWVRNAAELSARVNPAASVDVVLLDPGAWDVAPFLAAELAPRPVWCYEGLDNWRRRVTAIVVRDRRAVNAAARPPGEVRHHVGDRYASRPAGSHRAVIASLLITAVLFTSAGYAVAALCRIALPPRWPERLSQAFLLGVGGVGCTLFVLGVAGVPLSLPPFVIVATGAVTAGVVAGRRRIPISADGSPFPKLASLLLAIPFVAVAFSVAVIPLADHDGLMTWLPKARAIVNDRSLVGPFFRGAGGLNLHNHYPLLLPLDDAIVMRLSGSTSDASVRWLYLLIPLALLSAVRDRLATLYGAEAAGWVAAIVAWIPIITTGNGSAESGYSDLAVAAFAGTALLALLTSSAPLECGVWLAFLVLTKNEGALLCIALLATAAAMRLLRTRAEWFAAIAPPVIALGLLVLWRLMVPDAYDEQYAVLLRDFPHRLHRLGEASTAILRHMFDWKTWGLLWPAAMLALLGTLRSRVTAAAGLFLALSLGGYVLILAITSWNIDELARVAADRLLLHMLVPLCCLLANAWPNVLRPVEGSDPI